MIGESLSHYRIVEKLGEGGMGVVYRARDSRLDRAVAIKVLHPDTLAGAGRRRRLFEEARAASALNDPGIVTVYDVGQLDQRGGEAEFIVMECVEGRTLDRAIRERQPTIMEALDLAIQIARALAVAHAAGIVHGDVKPANLMVTDSGVVKVLDFGLAKPTPNAAHDGPTATTEPSAPEAAPPRTAPGVVRGTTPYMSPEQAEGRALDTRSDVFSLGVVLYELLAGRRPFQGDSYASLLSAILRDPPLPLRSLRADVPRDLARVVDGCLAKDRKARYASAGEVFLDLTSCRARFAARTSGWRAWLRRPRFAVPLALAAAALVLLPVWGWRRGAPRRWALGVALPEIERLLAASDYYHAYWLALQARNQLPAEPRLARFWKEASWTMTLRTSPPGAEVAVKSYRAPHEDWRPLGLTPLENVPVPLDSLRWRFSKAGYQTVLGSSSQGPLSRSLRYALDAAGAAPAGMVRVNGGPFAFRSHPRVELADFWLDRLEVTNRAYKRFVDAGGYAGREYWVEAFVQGGRIVPWEKAMGSFRDRTGRPGPATWALGTYPEGEAEHPVGGVSWFEAAAYARFVGRSLPTFYHWFAATELGRDFKTADIISYSNFGGRGAVAAGSLGGISPFGCEDMAGNVREWCATGSERERYILGGSWDEPAHAYLHEHRLSPWSRAAVNGFRCARYLREPSPSLPPPVTDTWRDYTKEAPASDEVFSGYAGFYDYDARELDARVEGVEEDEHWRRERVTFAAAYGGERMLAHLFLPRVGRPPYQTLVVHPTGEASLLRSSDQIRLAHFDFIVRTGRAILHPVYEGTYERGSSGLPAGPNELRDLVVRQVKDLRRSLDYLETRADIDRGRLGVFEVSGSTGLLALALDRRLKVGVAQGTGLEPDRQAAEIDPLNFAPRIRQPLLILNGRYDSELPLAEAQRPLLRLLGTPAGAKQLVLFDAGHSLLHSTDRVRTILTWLDQQLGPVNGP